MSLSAVDKVKILGKLPLEIYIVEVTECYYKEGKQTLMINMILFNALYADMFRILRRQSRYILRHICLSI